MLSLLLLVEGITKVTGQIDVRTLLQSNEPFKKQFFLAKFTEKKVLLFLVGNKIPKKTFFNDFLKTSFRISDYVLLWVSVCRKKADEVLFSFCANCEEKKLIDFMKLENLLCCWMDSVKQEILIELLFIDAWVLRYVWINFWKIFWNVGIKLLLKKYYIRSDGALCIWKLSYKEEAV